jgi:16S rRNA (cytidine1402-2'-O)-methyltransferase
LEILTEIVPEAQVCVARELTKKFETYHRGKPGELLDWFKSHGTKGEMVILMNASR